MDVRREVVPVGTAFEDERYAAGAGMRTTAGMQEVEQRRSSCRGATSLSMARNSINMRYNHLSFTQPITIIPFYR